ncbi:MAG: Na+/H+ antiporter NhaC family protein, partial [Parvularculaceae bacterium]
MTRKRLRGEMSIAEAIAPIVVMLVLFAGGAIAFKTGAATIVVAMLGAAAVAGISVVRVGAGWSDIERSAGAKFAAVLPVILILLAIGMLIGTWMLCGAIPYLVAFGLRLVSPDFIVLAAFLATCLMSIATGTSWGSAGTIGVAMMGMAAALDAPLAIVAGAVVSGAYFGDKLSPLSDTTNICAISVNIPLYRHIRHLLYTAAPSFVVACVVYALVGGGADAATGAKAAALIAEIDRVYDAPLAAMVPPVLVILTVAARTPPALAIAGSSLVAALIG